MNPATSRHGAAIKTVVGVIRRDMVSMLGSVSVPEDDFVSSQQDRMR